ncbi:unnamed protein product [Clonostachys rosea]|uniref:Uncharacterized protein n=1 Tax=Bionectria ochroleuca TaxID=29856 RepID=A0ABY6UFP4_BIOOC|nr:unnamed protein product [Clonostachys rosea]
MRQKHEKTPENDESQEQEIINRQISKGNVRKPSISWRNTLLKWTIDTTIGTLWSYTLKGILEALVYEAPKLPITTTRFVTFVCVIWISRLIRLSYIVSFIGFILIPAPQRPVFELGANAVIDIFLAAVSGILFPKVIRSSIVQKFMIDATEAQWRQIQSQGSTGPARVLDEL